MFPSAASTQHPTVTARTALQRPALAGAGGFTIVELMVTVTMAAIIMAVALPAMRTFVQNDRQWTESSSLVMALNTARNEAIKQDQTVQVCPSTTGTSCDTSGNWPEGWIVLVPGATSAVMSIGALPTGMTLTEASGQISITFLSTGMAQASAGFTMCDSRGANFARYTQVAKSGSVVVSVGQKPGGTALTCP